MDVTSHSAVIADLSCDGFRTGAGDPVLHVSRKWRFWRRRADLKPRAKRPELEVRLSTETPTALRGDPTAEVAFSLRMVAPRWVRRRPQGWRRYWYRGPEPYFDIFVDVEEDDPETVRWFQFTRRGQVLTWDGEEDRITTGVTNELSGESATFSSSKMLIPHNGSDPMFVRWVLQILSLRSDSPPLVVARQRVQSAAEKQGLCPSTTVH
ncbi:MAG: hypothetical protein AAFQ65_08940 [Myxococcota bacterium]